MRFSFLFLALRKFKVLVAIANGSGDVAAKMTLSSVTI